MSDPAADPAGRDPATQGRVSPGSAPDAAPGSASDPAADPLAAIAAALRAEGGLLAAATVDPAPDADRRIAAALRAALDAGPAASAAGEAPATSPAGSAPNGTDLRVAAPDPSAAPGPAAPAAAQTPEPARAATLALAAEATREAELLHHAPEHARVVRTDDRDLALLAGDRLYALGLARLAAGGHVDEVAILADIVALVARLHAEPAWAIGPATPSRPGAGTGAPDDARDRTRALWDAACAALAGGSSSSAAKLLRAVRSGGVPETPALAEVGAAVRHA